MILTAASGRGRALGFEPGPRQFFAGLRRQVAKWLATLRRSESRAMSESFDQDFFDDLVLYIAQRTRADRRFGRTKLAKVLYYSDLDAYRDTGRPITHATYIRMPFGPFPRELEESERRLAASGRAWLDYHVPAGVEKKIVPVRAAPETVAGQHIVDHFIRSIGEMSAQQVSEQTHREPGWLMAEKVGASIPYGVAFLPDRPPSRADEDEVERLARERGTLTDAGWEWERQR